MNFHDIRQSLLANRRKIWLALPVGLLVLGGCSSGNSAYNKTTDGGYHARSNSPGYKALQDGNYVYAAQYFEAANRETPNNPYFELDLAAAYQRQGRMAEAEPLLRQAMVHGADEDPVAWTTNLAENHTVAETACQNLDMGLTIAATPGTATECQRYRTVALAEPVAAPTPAVAVPVFQPAFVPVAVAVAPPVAVPVTQPAFVRGTTRGYIYFDFDKSGLTPTGKDQVNTFAAELRSDMAVQVVLLGKADHPGTDEYNMELSDRRTTEVRNALIAAGISGNRITSHYVGEREAPVVTAEATREQRNRVVELTIN